MTRLWTPADPITVVTRASPASGSNDGLASTGEPIRFTWQGQTHPIAQITREWRVDIDWWRERIWRVHYKLSTESGLLVVIFQDLLTNNWYLQRLYD